MCQFLTIYSTWFYALKITQKRCFGRYCVQPWAPKRKMETDKQSDKPDLKDFFSDKDYCHHNLFSANTNICSLLSRFFSSLKVFSLVKERNNEISV